ncbi:MAG: autotransporter-associated beta strand repeat-containing protein [Verrucomicrobia bacterium]|nr:autotransporter-associated beta strand repeat-containing protein [Verrucomicrobiota bacterium]
MRTSAGHTGTTAASNGTLVIAPTSGGSLTSASSGYSAANGATLRFDSSNIGGSYSTWNIKPVSVSAGGTVEIADSGVTHTGPTANSAVLANGAQFSGAGSLNKEGNGSIVINSTGGLDGFTGTLNVNQGILSLQGGSTSAVGNFIVNVASGATLDFRTDGQKTGAINGTGTIMRSYSAFGGTLSIGNDNRDGSFSGTIAASLDANMPLVKAGTGTQTFSGTNISYVAPTTVNGGKLALRNTSAFNSNVTLHASNTVTLELDAPGSGDSWTYSKQITGGSANATVEKTGSGTVIMSGNSSYSGTTTVSNGTLTAGHTNAFGTGTINVTGGTLALGSNSVTNAITLNGGKLTGSGVSLSNVTVGSDSFITGSFTGTLNTGTNPARAINTTGGATFQNLTGQATFSGGLVTLTGSHTPGNSPGTQTFNDGLSYADNSSLTLEIAADGSAWDFLNITGGSLTFGNNVSLTLGLFGTADYSTSFWDLDHTFTLVSSNALTGDFTGVNNLLGDAPAEGSWTYGWAGNDYQASWTAVPEPGAALLGGLGSLFLLRRRRHG